MDERIEIWNVLLDGQITAVKGQGRVLTMFVNIPYLRRRMKPLGDSFVLTIEEVMRIDFRDFDGKLETIQEAIDTGSPEILSTDSEDMPIKIFTTLGELILDFENIHFALDTGQKIDFASINKTCEDYWDEWEEKTKRNQQSPN